MEILDPRILQYSEAHTTGEPDVLKKLNRETFARVMKPRMMSGHWQGRFLAMISKMLSPRNILEIGTYTGYSAICLAEGLASGGKVITIDKNEELEKMVRKYFAEAGADHLIDYRIGNALTLIPQIALQFDLVFIDADKENNSAYFDLVIDKVPIGGYILTDNVLWYGKILDEKADKDTRAIHAFNEKVQADSRVENVLVPVRDGIMLMRKVKDKS